MSGFDIFVYVLRTLFVLVFALSMAPLLVYFERKVSAYIQDRPGPNRVNILGVRLAGTIQSLADALKLLFKEDFRSQHIKNKKFFLFAPGILFMGAMFSFAMVPFAGEFEGFAMQAIPTDMSMLWYLAFSGLSVYAMILAGYASENKYSLLGTIRAASQTISYEIAMGLAVVSMIITYESFSFDIFVQQQSSTFFGVMPFWGVLAQPLACIIFIVTIFAECNRAPFDLAEGESEIVAGYHTEYSAMRLGLFLFAEYIAMTAASAVIITLFFGGYNLPYLDTKDLTVNADYIVSVIAIVTPLLFWKLHSWVKKNNQVYYKAQRSFFRRELENRFYTYVFSGIMAIIEIICLSAILVKGALVTTLILQILIFSIKVLVFTLIFIWVRWTLPRFRYDQLQKLGWEKLVPLGIFNVIVTAIVAVLVRGF